MHYFSLHTTGLKRIKVTATNVPSGDQNLTASGRASPFKNKAFFVEKKSQSYLYRSSEIVQLQNVEIVPISYPSTATKFQATLPIRVWNPEIYTLEEAYLLTQELADYGEIPDVSLSDPTLTVDSVQYNSTLMAWIAAISGKASIKTFTVIVKKSSLLGDSVQETRISISLFPILISLWPEQANLPSADVLRIPIPVLGSNSVTCHPCSGSVCAQFNSFHIMVTRDRFITSQNITYLIKGGILDVRFSQNKLMVATNQSLYFISLNYSNSVNRQFSYAASHASIGSTSQCPIPDMVARELPIFLSVWNDTGSVVTYSCQGASCQKTISNIMLSTPVSLPNRNTTFHLIRDGNNLRSLIKNTYTLVTQTGFLFPGCGTNSSVVIVPFAYGHGLFVFVDSALWIARDDGLYFTTISIPGPKPDSVQITSSSTSAAYTVHDLTNGIAYCGRTYMDFITPCYIGHPHLSSSMNFWFDNSDLLHLTYMVSSRERIHIFVPSGSYSDSFWLSRFTAVKALPSALNTFIVPVPGYGGFDSDPRFLLVDSWNFSLQEWAYDIDMGYLQLTDIGQSSSLLATSISSQMLFEITNFGLAVTAINGSGVTATLQIMSTPNQIVNTTIAGWYQAHLFCTVWVKNFVFLINRYINGTHIGAAVITSGTTLSRLSSAGGEWRIWDYRPYRNEAVVGQQSIQLRATSNSSYFQLSLSPGIFSFNINHVGHLVAFNATWGVISNLISASTVKCVFGANSVQSVGNRTYQAGQWSMIELDFDADISLMPDIFKIAKRSFGFAVPPCPYDDTSVVTPLPYQYLDKNESANISIFVPESKTKPQLSLFGIQISSAMVSLQISSYENQFGTLGVNVSLMLTDVGACQNCIATAIFGTKGSMQCTPAALPAYSHVIMGCPPGKRIAPDTTQINSNMLDLHTNYRPPSALGLGVPISPNIYNADPSHARAEFMKISQTTEKYKNCTGLGTDSCVCIASGGTITPITQTDCIRRVPAANYGDEFQIPFLILDGDVLISTLTNPYQIIELNGRDDFCISLSTVCLINTSPYIIDPSQNTGIRWAGEGLYHFRVLALQGSYCELTTEFLVFVTHAPLQTAVSTFVIAMTAMIIGIALLIAYVYKNSQLQRAIQHRAAFVLNKQYITKPKTL